MNEKQAHAIASLQAMVVLGRERALESFRAVVGIQYDMTAIASGDWGSVGAFESGYAAVGGGGGGRGGAGSDDDEAPAAAAVAQVASVASARRASVVSAVSRASIAPSMGPGADNRSNDSGNDDRWLDPQDGDMTSDISRVRGRWPRRARARAPPVHTTLPHRVRGRS